MKIKMFVVPFVVCSFFLAAACGGDNGKTDDTATEDTVPVDGQDQQHEVDVPPDQPVDTPPDQPVDQPADDVPTEPEPDAEQDVVEEDVVEDVVEDPHVDGETACESAGGYCSSYPVVPNPCIKCEPVGETPYKPAPPSDGAMECTTGGVGATPWCCLPNIVTAPTDCDTAGGVCYPFSSGMPCPVGWNSVYTACTGEGSVCCMPGDTC